MTNSKSAKNSNFGLFYKYESEKSYLIFFIGKYKLIDIQYISNFKQNKFKLKNIIKFNISIKCTKKADKNVIALT